MSGQGSLHPGQQRNRHGSARTVWADGRLPADAFLLDSSQSMMWRGRFCLGIAIIAPLLGGCAEGIHVYRPANATSSGGELPPARDALPADHPTGASGLASSRLTELAGSQGPVPPVLLRM